MPRLITLILLHLFSLAAFPQSESDTNSISLLFIGDIMGHGSQIKSAFVDSTKQYNYEECFKFMKPEISEADFAIANLEVTLAGPPYKGYPQFSSPDALALACKGAGIDCLVTANNHSCDRGKAGIIRTINMIDSFNFMRAGTYLDESDRRLNYPMILEKNNIKIAILNYTYGTNGLPTPSPTIVNRINRELIKEDILKAKTMNVDKIIIILHWGIEYQSTPNSGQTGLADFCVSNGADIIIGMHPHVVQKFTWEKDTINGTEKFVAYSLGNFVSNQRKRKQDGGTMLKLIISKSNNKASISEAGYYLTWVYKPIVNGKVVFHIIPGSKYENNKDFFVSEDHPAKMKIFTDDSRKLFNSQNINVKEYKYSEGKWKLSNE